MSGKALRFPKFVPGYGMILVTAEELGAPPAEFGSNSAAQDRVRAARGGTSGGGSGGEGVEPSSLLADVDGPAASDVTLPPGADAVSLPLPRGVDAVSLPKPDRPFQGSATRKGFGGKMTAGRYHGGFLASKRGVDAAAGVEREPGRRVSGALGWDGASTRGAVGFENVIERGADDEVVRAEGGHVGWDADSVQAGWSETNGGREAGATVAIGADGVDVEGSYGPASLSFGGDEDELRFGGGLKSDHASLTGSYTSYGRGHVDAGVTDDAFLEDAIGTSRYASRRSGHAASLGGEVGGTFSVGGSVSESDVAKASFHSASAGEGYEAALALAGRLDGVSDYDDVDLDALAAGEAYAFERQSGSGVSGSVGVGPLSGSIGTSDAASTRTTLARDALGDLRVSVATGSASTDTAGVSVGGLLGASASDTSARGASAAFRARGEAGERAVRGWQDTGLLPGAVRVAARLAPEAHAAWQAAMTELQFRRMQDDGSPFSRVRIDAAHDRVRALAEPLNRAFLNARDEGLGGADVEGITWDERTTTRQTHSGADVSVAGMSIADEGVTDTFTDRFYREGGEERKEAGFQREDDYWSSPTETSRIAVDPRGDTALRMFSEWEAWQTSHDSLAALGPDAFDLPPEVVEAWRTGALDKGENTRLMLALSDADVAELGELIGEDDPDSAGAWDRIGDDVVGMRDYMRSMDMSERGRADRERIRLLLDAAVISRRGDGPPWWKHASAAEHETNALCASLAGVNTPEEFAALNDAEKRVVIGTAVIAAARRKSNPWDAMRLVMSLPPGRERNELIRELFVQIESNRKGSNAAIEFVQFVQAESAEAGIDPRSILSAVRVETADGARDLRAETAKESASDDPAAAAEQWATTLRNAVGEWVRPAHDAGPTIVWEAMNESSGKEVADWMRIIVDRSGRRGLEDALRVASRQSPRFFKRLNARLADDPYQRDIVRYLLEGTAYRAAVG